MQKYEYTQEHALLCDSLKVYLSLKNIQLPEDIHYSDLFGSVNERLRIAEVCLSSPVYPVSEFRGGSLSVTYTVGGEGGVAGRYVPFLI